MTKLRISFTNIIEVEHLEAMAMVHGYKKEKDNPDYDPAKPEGEANKRLIPVDNTLTAVEYAIKVLAGKTGDMVTHEVTCPIQDDLSPRALQERKQEVIDALKANFELKVETV